ncbi:Acyl carrier protein [Candidatus Magnetomoraceae bacterium gMMP-15]
MNYDEIFNKIKQAFKEAFDTDSELVNINTTPEQIPGWDSLGHTVLGIKLEEIFKTSFDIDDLMAMENVKSIIQVIQKKLQ